MLYCIIWQGLSLEAPPHCLRFNPDSIFNVSGHVLILDFILICDLVWQSFMSDMCGSYQKIYVNISILRSVSS